ncbi:MAG TPA: MazG nucleotide pyrophosphohydrolase domain-containing protein, partial [Deltaproteobacteria bacterium]|nr:MazG nucleotide pyrophosphohydrolase domain-containing protein [Deltaproteobacteria bacterium]
YARKIQSAVSRVGFDWDNPQAVIGKIREEADELLEAVKSGDGEEIESEIGDLLFSIVNLARHAGADPETALRKTNRKFKERFSKIEDEAKKRGIPLEDMSLAEMDEIWESAKRKA